MAECTCGTMLGVFNCPEHGVRASDTSGAAVIADLQSALEQATRERDELRAALQGIWPIAWFGRSPAIEDGFNEQAVADRFDAVEALLSPSSPTPQAQREEADPSQ